MLSEYFLYTSFLLLFYIYFGYPVAVFILSKIFKRAVSKGPHEPLVSMIIAAHNEEKCIGKTLENKLALNYPKKKMEVIVISDGSTDKTDDIVNKFKTDNIRLLRQEPRKGKTSALNMAVSEAKGEVIVFSDANSIYEADALRHILENFNDHEVGYVTGKMIYTNPDGSITGDGCSAYMKYENFLRKYETEIGSVVGVDGGIDAVRKSLYKPMRADQLPDFILPLMVIEQGYRVVYEPNAILKEDALNSSINEYRMRVRVSLRALWALSDMRRLINPLKYGIFSWQLLSHKTLRYMAFMLLICLYISNVFLWNKGTLFQVTFLIQNAFYLTAYWGRREKGGGLLSKFVFVPYYFTLINLAAAQAFWKFLNRKKQIIWNPRTG
jgi:cellulose synthase/poly-beta-1,6-N-acetylglucosamine synthase-like glycosyltransferase